MDTVNAYYPGFNNTTYWNDTDEYDAYTPFTERPETYIVPVIFGLIFVIGTLGNGTLVLIFIRHRSMRNVPNMYIFSLAVGDLFVILTCVPFTSTVYTVESWPYGDAICKISEWTKDVSIGVSVFTLTALSAERYCAIVNPMRRHAASGRLGAKVFTLMTALFIWLLAVCIAMPSLLYSRVQVQPLDFNRTILICTPFPSDKEIPNEYGIKYSHVMVVFKFLAYYAFPLCVIAWFYVLMAVHLEASTRNMPGESQGQAPQIRARKKVAKMVLAFVVIFVVCFGPYHTFMLWFHLHPNSRENFDEFWHAFRIVGFCLSFFNSCINPIALYFISGTFRKYFNMYLFCCCVKVDLERRSTTKYDTSTHTMVHFGSTVRRANCNLDETSVVTANTALYHLDKT
ncbi:UNVERIFIED_CONTAM: hypothetical protein PYX00_003127 [Menopon gallinae]|uniref:G-protein coupled receptors family 1 profile domain-containing protein n=1 Tax=Menopon gallinae TaxID=328185 RepID=A0AAW2HYS1_9NEOP